MDAIVGVTIIRTLVSISDILAITNSTVIRIKIVITITIATTAPPIGYPNYSSRLQQAPTTH